MPTPSKIDRFFNRLYDRIMRTANCDGAFCWDGDIVEGVREMRFFETITEVSGGGPLDGAATYHGYTLCLTDVLAALSTRQKRAHIHLHCALAYCPHTPSVIIDGTWEGKPTRVLLCIVPPPGAPIGARANTMTKQVEELDEPIWPDKT